MTETNTARSSGQEALVAATGLRKTYSGGAREVTALRGVDLTVAAGEWVAIMGPSGCGKSTLLSLLGGLDLPDAGTIRIGGDEISGRSEADRAVLRRSLVGYMFQASNLVPDLSVAENIELPAQLAGAGRRQARKLRQSLLDELGLADTADAFPAELSGGQQQRIALARALVNHPPLLLADEPTGALDTESARTVLAALRRRHEEGQTIVLVTHDHRVAAAADRVLVMQDGEIRDERRMTALVGEDTLLGALPPLEAS